MGYGERLFSPAHKQPATCDGCILSGASNGHLYPRSSTGFVLPEGTGANGVIVVAERAGDYEIADGLPLRPQGSAGSVFERILRQLGIARSQFKIINILSCCIPDKELKGQSYEYPAIEHCRIHRDRLLLDFPASGPAYKQKVILAMGDVAARTLTGLAGYGHNIDKIRGYPVETPYGLVIPTYDPKRIQREPRLQGVLKYDIQYAVNIARRGWTPAPTSYLEDPTVPQGWAFYDRAKALCATGDMPLITCDIENDYDATRGWVRLKSVQFSIGKNEGIFFDAVDEFEPIIRALCALKAQFWFHNGWRHDIPILTKREYYSEGIKWTVELPWLVEFGGPIHDSLWAFHHAQPDLTSEETEDGTGISSKMGLEYVASLYGYPRRWKFNLKMNLRYYGICDVDALQYIVPPLVEQLKAKGMWQSYLLHIQRYDSILQRISERGIPVNETQRLKVKAELSIELAQEAEKIQGAYPHELKNIEPKQGYTRPPTVKEDKIRHMDWGPSLDPLGYEWLDDDDEALPVWREMEYRLFKGLKLTKKVACACFTLVTHRPDKVNKKGVVVAGKPYAQPKKVYAQSCALCAGKKTYTQLITEEHRWVKVIPFKPSKDQIIRYMQYRKHKVPVKKGSDGVRRQTTDYKELEKLALSTGDQLYKGIVSYRKLEKLISTYVDGWKPQADGFVHPVFLGSTATAQLASEKPNALNPPKHNEVLANKFRSMIIAPEGHTFIEMDYKSYHGATLAAESGDEVYYKIAVKVGDAHSFLASYLVKEPIDPTLSIDELKERCAYIKSKHKKIRNTSAKQANLGYGFGMQGPGLYERYPEYFENQEHACKVITMLDRLYDKNKKWRDGQVEEAYQNGGKSGSGWLLSKFGHVRWFHSIYAHRKYPCVHCDGQAGHNYQCWICHGKGTYWERKNGGDMEDIYAFKPANHAHCNFREVQIRLDDRGLLEKYQLCLPYHDALYFLCPDVYLEEAIHTAYAEMVKPIVRLANPVLCPNGLVVDVDVNVGKAWDQMKGFKVTS